MAGLFLPALKLKYQVTTSFLKREIELLDKGNIGKIAKKECCILSYRKNEKYFGI